MTRPFLPRRPLAAAALGASLLAPLGPALAADGPYPFEGTWTQVEHVCSATTTRVRTYTAREVTSPRGKCTIRRVIPGSSTLFELQEDCRRTERSGNVTEIIRMTSPDSFVLKRQVVRLKIPRQIRFVRCSAAAPGAPPPPAAPRPTVRPAAPAEPRRAP